METMSPRPSLRVAALRALVGETAEAEVELREAIELSDERYVSPFRVAEAWAALGETERAFEWLERAFEERSWAPAIRWSAAFDPMRSDPASRTCCAASVSPRARSRDAPVTEPSPLICPACQHENPSGANFCQECGTRCSTACVPSAVRSCLQPRSSATSVVGRPLKRSPSATPAPTPRSTWPTRSSSRSPPWKASASRSRSCSRT